MSLGSRFSINRLATIFAIAVVSSSALMPSAIGQAAPAASGGPALSRVDLFAGYTYWKPFNSDIYEVPYATIPFGITGNITGYITPHFGVQAEGNYSPNASDDNDCAYTAQVGPAVRFQSGRLVPFAHILGGGAIVGGPRYQNCNTWGFGATAGGGFDYILPILHDHLAIRPIQADLVYAHIDNGPDVGKKGAVGNIGKITAIRASAGIVFRFGDMGQTGAEAPTFNCSAEPAQVFPGDPITLQASTLNVNPKRKPSYLWTSSGGKVAGDEATAAIDTVNMLPGVYQVSGQLVQGDKQRLVASCTTSFTVRAYEPPTLSCSADHNSINSGDPVAIRATGISPQNRPLSYSYGTTAGLISGTGSSAALSTVGVSPGDVTVTCNVVDDKGQTATSNVTIVVAQPPPPPPAPIAPAMQSLCSITFDRDTKRPDRVDNEAKGCLDDVALTLNRETSDKLLIIGSHADKETNRDSAVRAMNAAEYLTKEKGIDPTRLDLRIGPDNGRTVALMLVPPGAVIDSAAATSFDTSTVKRNGPAYGTAKAKKAAPKTAKPAAKKPKPITSF